MPPVHLRTLLVALSVLLALHHSLPAEPVLDRCEPGSFRNLIVMIPDGCDAELETLARWVSGERLQLDEMGLAAVTVEMAGSVITCSAAAATAMACGHKTSVRRIGVGPNPEAASAGIPSSAPPTAPLASVLEAARLAGKATGLAVTSSVTHATPAGYYAHVPDRGQHNEIMLQLIHAGVDVVLGGGAQYLLPAGTELRGSDGDGWPGVRKDGLDLRPLLAERGYTLVHDREELRALQTGRVFGLFAAEALAPDIDREAFAPSEPTLAECVEKAIELLAPGENGFFLLVEGSQVDWGGHDNDPAYQLSEFLAFDAAVAVACRFAAEDGSTLVLALADHNTGGLRIGQDHAPVRYTSTSVADLVEPLRRMQRTAWGIQRGLADTTQTALRAAVLEHWGVDLSAGQLAEIGERRQSEGFSRALSRVVCRDHTILGWTSGGHTGGSVPLRVFGATAPQRTLDNTEIARLSALALGLDLDAATAQLFVPLTASGLEWTLVPEGEDAPLLRVGGGLELPINRNWARLDNRRLPLPGLVLHLEPTGEAYAPRAALELLGR
jgi:alkaline phosphatase